ncbi:hypothetical protein [Streptomyces sp. NPDC055134]
MFNQIMDRSRHYSAELTRVRREIVRHGRLDERVEASPGQDSWASRVKDVNTISARRWHRRRTRRGSWTRWPAATSRGGSTCTTGTAGSGGTYAAWPRREQKREMRRGRTPLVADRDASLKR